MQAISVGTVQFYCSAKSLQSCPTLWDPTDHSPPGSPIPGILQARVLEWGAIVFSSSIAQSCPILCEPMDCSTPGLPVHRQLPEFTKLMSLESVMPSNHLILCCPLLLTPSIFPSIRSFRMSQFFASGGQSTGVSASASVLPMNIQD